MLLDKNLFPPQFDSEEALLDHRRDEHATEMLSECSDCGKVYQRTEDLRLTGLPDSRIAIKLISSKLALFDPKESVK